MRIGLKEGTVQRDLEGDLAPFLMTLPVFFLTISRAVLGCFTLGAGQKLALLSTGQTGRYHAIFSVSPNFKRAIF